jgi:Ca-activated chloride channel family protein
MGDPGKLDLVKDALSTLVTQLHPTDSVAIVTFSSSARIVRRMTRVSERRDLLAAIDGLRIEGSTNLAAGLTKGYEVAREGFRPGATNRVVILSDGLANTGDTDPQRLIDQVREAAAKKITLLGVGVGNDYGDALMEKLVDNGDGFVVYVSDRDQARRVFVDRLPATASLRALDAKAQVTFDPATVASYRLVGYDDRALAASDFRNDHVDGGEVAAGFTVTALYVVTLEPGAYGQVAEARVRWLDPTTRAALEQAATVTVGDLDGSFAEASPRLQVCFVAGYFAEVLRGSPYGNDVRLSDLAVIAAGAGDRTEDPAVTDLAATIRRAADLR